MNKVLANDGISHSGISVLENAGFEVITAKVAQEQLINYINKNQVAVILVRSATKVRKDIIDACPCIKIIGRGGVGMDNIDVDYAKSKGIEVINTPAASSASVAELVFAHLFGGVRFLYDSNRQMPMIGETKFGELKKAYAKGSELSGKTIGIIGFGKIGIATAKVAIGLGMKVIAYDKFIDHGEVIVDFFDGQKISFKITMSSFEDVLQESDFISLHVPAQDGYVIGKNEIEEMKDGVALVNASRGGIVDEKALVEALNKGKLSFAALDVFENEPNPELELLMHPKISLTPHIGAATGEAQERIGTELAEKIIAILKD